MKFNLKRVLASLMLPAAMFVFAGCATEDTPFNGNDEAGYTVSVKYDANGGFFGDGATVFYDCFNPDKIKKNSEGMVEIPLIAPDNTARDKSATQQLNDYTNAMKIEKEDYYFAGWYQNKTKVTDEDGKVSYEYSDKWNFDSENYGNEGYTPDILTVDPSKEYSSETPVLTLYAAWVPKLTITYYDIDTKEKIGDTKNLNFVSASTEDDAVISLPYWEEQGVTINMGEIPEKAGYTFLAAYSDKEGTDKIDGESFNHSAAINPATFEVKGDTDMSVYLKYSEGKEYRIYTVDDFRKNFSTNGHYTLYGDLDFTDTFWPDMLTTNAFTGTIDGQGHTISNVEIIQRQNNNNNFGLFGNISETATIKDLKLDNITLTIEKGSKSQGALFGLLAGTISKTAVIENVEIDNSTVIINPSKNDFLYIDCIIGLVSGSGDLGIDYTGIQHTQKEGVEPTLGITQKDSLLTLTDLTAEQAPETAN